MARLNVAELARKIRKTNHLRFFTPGTWRRMVLMVKVWHSFQGPLEAVELLVVGGVNDSFAVAIARSLEAGAGGAIWLESLPGAADFYEGLGMARQPRRSAEDNFIYILDPATAEHLLEEIKERGIVVLR